MTKAALIILGLAASIALPLSGSAQENSSATAVNEAVMRQANQIVLRNKLAEAKAAEVRGDIVGAAKVYQECINLTQEIGSGAEAETKRSVSGLVANRLILARDAQGRGDLREADVQIKQVLKVDSKNNEAILFKDGNDRMLSSLKGRMPDVATLDRLPQIGTQKTQSGTLAQDGKVLYEAGKLDDAEVKFNEALVLDPDNSGAYYYLNLIKQTKFARSNAQHTVDSQERMSQVEKRWVLPVANPRLPIPNAYATNNLVYTGGGRQAIVAKLEKTHFDTIAFDGVPLGEVLRIISEKTKLADPDHKGINFLVDPNPDLSGQPVAVAQGGGGGGGIDPATGLPTAAPAPAPAAAPAGEAIDPANFMVKLNLTDVCLRDLLDSIIMVAQNPTPGDTRTVRFLVQDFAIVFQLKPAETPQLFMRSFRVDPNTFYSGLANVSAMAFTGASGGAGGGGGGGRGGGGGGRGGGGAGGGGQNGQDGPMLGVVDAFGGGVGGGGGGGRGGGGGGRGGGGGAGGAGGGSLLDSAAVGGGAGGAGGAGGGRGGQGGQNGGGGLDYITKQTSGAAPSVVARDFFAALGVNLVAPPGKSIFFNDRLGLIFVRATEQDLDIIERAIETLNKVSPQVHIKSRFIEVQQDDSKALGFDWYLGQFKVGGKTVMDGGTAPSLNAPGSPTGVFPGNTSANVVSGAATDQSITSGLRNSAPVLGTLTGIMTDPNFRMVLHALEQRTGVENLAEPEVTTMSGRQTQMKATKIINVVTDFTFDNGAGNGGANNNTATGNGGGNVVNQAGVAAITPTTTPVETGPVLDVVPYVLSDGYTINLALIPSLTAFDGYESIAAGAIPGYNPGAALAGAGGNGGTAVPVALPSFTMRQVVTTVNVWDNQTVALGGLISSSVQSTKDKVPMLGDIPLLGRLFQSQSKTAQKKNLMIFVTATIVDPAGNRIHTDDDLPFAQTTIPAQPPGAGQAQESVQKVNSLTTVTP